MTTCPFCQRDPYEYVDVGVGGIGVPVAVTCCELGIELFDRRDTTPETVTVSWNDFTRIADWIRQAREAGFELKDAR